MLIALILLILQGADSETPAKIIFSSNQNYYIHPTYYRQGTPVTFNCVGSGYPPPIYKWFRNDRRINVDDNPRMRLDDGNLTIHEVDHDLDDGTYQCLIMNDFGSDVTHPIQFRTQVIGEFKENVDKVSEIPATIGKPLLIPCPESTYFYPKIFDWSYKSDLMNIIPLKQDHRVNIMKNGTLFFSYLLDEDVNKINGRNGIQCVIFSGNEMTRSKTFRISPVTVGQENDFAPYFLEKISGEKTTRLDSFIQLQCSAVGRPAPDIRWYHNNELVNESMRGYKTNHNHLMLEISIYNVDMGGEYMCRVNNTVDGKENVLTAKQDIVVDRKPHWLIEPQDQYIAPGGHLHVFCLARGIPRPTHQWYSNGEKVDSPHQVNGTNMTDGILDIPNARGVYKFQCKASNSFGEISKTIVVTAVVTTTTTTTTPLKTADSFVVDSSSSVTMKSSFSLLCFLSILYSFI